MSQRFIVTKSTRWTGESVLYDTKTEREYELFEVQVDDDQSRIVKVMSIYDLADLLSDIT